MKELLNRSCNVAEFFNEKRFVFERGGPELPAPVEEGSLGHVGTDSKNVLRKGANLIGAGRLENPENKKRAQEELREIMSGKKDVPEEEYNRSAEKIIRTIERQWNDFRSQIANQYNESFLKKLESNRQNPSVKASGEEMEMAEINVLDRIPGGDRVLDIIQTELAKNTNKKFYDASIVKYYVNNKYDLDTDAVVSDVLKRALPRGFDGLVSKDILAMTRIGSGRKSAPVARRTR